ncbi:enoyl-CoA hydratase [Marinitoga sp. 1135]|uniref:Acyl dehydratase n=1 Tax=Marinitoga piezophila (strain DSM 14283 / JCM 11233 / KA3) TaxID=443254 RepID=H2J564_MARPK|nr:MULTISPECIES: MaoC family dehydratase [Marinitoga]AEX84922.1 acyl dehydratase [Marinitoga piezophila KA3]APT75428.1 enoyl-CoA hydratase [Marinitoga sp. 1137]NUU95156.1 enoyl-CoA hydratase [Marinitoga sp. 1135]NUU97088.1 enoyl-CoA hydratase [Marinitoga sp. 1138]
MKYDEIKLGQIYEVKRKITAHMVETFAEITGDKNPVHLDEEYASKTIFKKRIAHGILSVGLISAVLGMEFPGPGTIYMKQDTKFLKPIYIDEEITIKITVKEKIEAKSRLLLTTQIFNENGDIAVDGEALVLFKN